MRKRLSADERKAALLPTLERVFSGLVRLPIDEAPVPDTNDQDDQTLLLDATDTPVVANTVPPKSGQGAG